MNRVKWKTHCLVCFVVIVLVLSYILKGRKDLSGFLSTHSQDGRFDYQLLLVGIGNIGVRHLQSLMKLTDAVHIAVVDPSGPAIKRGQSVISQEEIANSRIRVSFFESLDTFSVGSVFDVGIIATNSDVRRTVIEDVLACCNVRYLILEKVLFQTEEDHIEMQRLFKKYNVKAYVHTQWRTVPLAKYLKNSFEPPVNLRVNGNEWGLCCNSIHFLTLATFLNDKNRITIDGSHLQPGYVMAKRQGFVEIFGELSSTIVTPKGMAKVTLQCNPSDASDSRNVTVFNRQGTVTWNEKTGLASGTFIEGGQNTRSDRRIYPFPMVSSWTSLLVKQLLLTGQCELPLYQATYEMSIELNNVFLAHLGEAGNDDALRGVCPIT